MNRQFHMLLVEDNSHDVHLIEQELSAAGFSFRLTLIESEVELHEKLDFDKPDIILSDHGLPSFSGFTALQIVRDSYPDLPFIFVSGSNNQAMVLEMFERGATDYVFKGDIHDLGPVVHRVLDGKSQALFQQTSKAAFSSHAVLKAPSHSSASLLFSESDYLSFCPNCRRVRDGTGQYVQLEEYFGSHSEIVVLRKPCPQCASFMTHIG